LCFRCFEANGFVGAGTLVTVSIAHHVARAATVGFAAKTVRLRFSRGAALAHEAARRERNVVDLNLPNMCFRLSIWPNGHHESQKYEFAN
jgi:hypothetical protein